MKKETEHPAETRKQTFFMVGAYADYHKVPDFRETKSNNGLVLYGDNNNYPDYLVELYNRSGKHNAIITHKVSHLLGQGIVAQDKDAPVKQVAEADRWVDNANPNESWNEVLYKAAGDFELFNGFAFEVVYNAKGSIAAVYHVSFNRVRTNYTCSTYYYSPEWERQRTSVANAIRYKPFNAHEPAEKLRGEKRLFYYREYRPGMGVYPLPDYIGCIVSVETDVEIANFHLNNTRNQFWGGKLISFNNGVPEEAQQAEIERRLKYKFAGTDNTGRFITTFSDNADQAPTITDLTPTNLDKLFEQLREDVTQEIFTGHKIHPVLLGIETAGKLGARNEVRDQHELFTKNYVRPRQSKLIKVINFFKEQMLPANDTRLTIKPLEPIQIEFSENGYLALMDRDEARRNFLKGYDLDADPAAPVSGKGQPATPGTKTPPPTLKTPLTHE